MPDGGVSKHADDEYAAKEPSSVELAMDRARRAGALAVAAAVNSARELESSLMVHSGMHGPSSDAQTAAAYARAASMSPGVSPGSPISPSSSTGADTR